MKRLVQHYGKSRPDLPENCPENFRWRTIEFLDFIWRTRHTARAKMELLCKSADEQKNVYRLTSLKEVDAFLSEVDAGRVEVA